MLRSPDIAQVYDQSNVEVYKPENVSIGCTSRIIHFTMFIRALLRANDLVQTDMGIDESAGAPRIVTVQISKPR